MKYVVFESKVGYLSCAIFGDEVVHKDVAQCGRRAGLKAVGAGFCHRLSPLTPKQAPYGTNPTGGWAAFGESETLKLKADVLRDSMVLTAALDHGLTGLDLMNALAYALIQQGKQP